MKCFEKNKEKNKNCNKKSCKYWIKCKSFKNCTIIAAEDGPKTLQEIGTIFDVTRMRVCQIEKDIVKKIKAKIKSSPLL